MRASKKNTAWKRFTKTGAIDKPLFSFEKVTRLVEEIDPDTGEPVLDEFGEPTMVEETVEYETATTFQNIFFGKSYFELPADNSWNPSTNLSAPVFENNHKSTKIDWINVQFGLKKPAETTTKYIPTLFWNAGGTQNFTNCSLVISAKNVGGHIGGYFLNTQGTITMTNCTATGTISNLAYKAAGMVKEVNGGTLTMIGCVNNVNVDTSAGSALAGGLVCDVAAATLIMDNCINNGNINAGSNCGGLIASVANGSTGLTVTNSTNNGTVTSTRHHNGGCIGTLNLKSETIVPVVENLTNNGAVTQKGTGGYVGGIIGNMGRYNTTFSGLVNNAAIVSGQQIVGGIIGRIAIDAGSANWKDNLFVLEDCHNTEKGTVNANVLADLGGIIGVAKGTPGIRVKLVNCTNAAEIGANSTGHRIAAGMVAITDQVAPHTEYVWILENCVNTGRMVGGTLGAAGMMGYCQDATLFDNCINTGEIVATAYGAGGMTAYVHWRVGTGEKYDCCKNEDGTTYWTTKAPGVKIQNCINTGVINAAGVPAGGMVGFGQDSSSVIIDIDNCANYANVTGKDAGGILALLNNGTIDIDGCVNYGDVTGSQVVGGIAGWVKKAVDFTNCVNYGDVKGVHGVGGILGEARPNSNFTNCLNAGDVAGSSNNAQGMGGIVGRLNNGTPGAYNVTLKNCANIGTITGANKANESHGCFNEGFGQLIGRLEATNGNNPWKADGEQVEASTAWIDTGDVIDSTIKLDGCFAFGAAQVNPNATVAPSEAVIGYKIVESENTDGSIKKTNTLYYTITDGDALPTVPNGGLYGDNVKVTADSSVDTTATVAELKAAGFKANFELVDGKIVVDNTPSLKGYQVSTDGKAIRFAATTDDASVESVGFNFTLTYNGEVVANTTADAENLLYSVKASGIATELAATYGGKYFSTITFENVPAEGTLVIDIQATVDGVATGVPATVTFVDGVIQK